MSGVSFFFFVVIILIGVVANSWQSYAAAALIVFLFSVDLLIDTIKNLKG